MKYRETIDRAVFLDLDGVLFDTVREAYCVATLAAQIFRDVRKIDFCSRHFRLFRLHRSLIKSAGDYYYLLKAIDKKFGDNKTDIVKEFKRLHGKNPEALRSFKKKYFEKREYLKDNNYGYWLSLNIPYGFLSLLLPVMKDKEKFFFIITTKDKETVAHLLSAHNIAFCKSNIYDNRSYEHLDSKGDIIRSIKAKYGIRRALFLEDSKEHLSSCGRIKGLRLVHAGWGYARRDNCSHSGKEALSEIKKILGA